MNELKENKMERKTQTCNIFTEEFKEMDKIEFFLITLLFILALWIVVK